MLDKKIIRNAAQCKLCKTIVESTYCHDWRQCKCGAMFVDGGKEYVRRGARSFDDVHDLTEYEGEPKPTPLL